METMYMITASVCKSVDWFLYDNGLRHEKVKGPWLSYYLLLTGLLKKVPEV